MSQLENQPDIIIFSITKPSHYVSAATFVPLLSLA